MSLFADFAINAIDALETAPIDKDDFIVGVMILADSQGQYVVTTEESTENTIHALKAAIAVISNEFNEVPELKN